MQDGTRPETKEQLKALQANEKKFQTERAAALVMAERDHGNDKDVKTLAERRIKLQAELQAAQERARALQNELRDVQNALISILEQHIPKDLRMTTQ